MNEHLILDTLFQIYFTGRNANNFAKAISYYKIAASLLRGEKIDWKSSPTEIAGGINAVMPDADVHYLMDNGSGYGRISLDDRYIFKCGEHIITIRRPALKAETKYKNLIIQSLKLTGFTYRSKNNLRIE